MSAEIMRCSPLQLEFYGTLGHAIVQWAHVERGLYFVYHQTIGAPESVAHAAAFFSVINFNAKLAMVDCAIVARYRRYPALLEKWATIKNRLGRRAKIRNDLAHWQLIIDARDGEYVHKLVPQLFDPNPLKTRTERPSYTVPEIEEHDRKFRQIRQELDDFYRLINEAPHPEFDGQEEDRRTPRDRADQTRAIPPPPPQSFEA